MSVKNQKKDKEEKNCEHKFIILNSNLKLSLKDKNLYTFSENLRLNIPFNPIRFFSNFVIKRKMVKKDVRK